jgi:BASS family bile acid:Na+ symporter
MLARLTDAFPLWVGLAALAGWWIPSAVAPLGEPVAVRWMLTVVMLGMGLTITMEDFRRVLSRPRDIGAAASVQFLVMPSLAWAIAEALALPPGLAVGLILVGCAPGGTASNIVTFLARGDTALSVLMTVASTSAAIVLTPLLTELLAGRHLPVDGWALLRDMFMLILAPVAAGVLLNRFAPGMVRAYLGLAPLVAVLAVAAIVGGIVARSAGVISVSAPVLFLSVAALHAGGFGLGRLAGRLLGWDTRSARTLSIEVGMQNSGLAASLAQRHFPSEPSAAAVAAVSAVFHSVIGSALAAWWRRRGVPVQAVAIVLTSHQE